MNIHESTPQISKGARIPDASPMRDEPRARSEARAERTVERKPTKAGKAAPARHFGAGF